MPLPPEPKGGGHTRLRVRGWGSPNSDDWRKSLALCGIKYWWGEGCLTILLYLLQYVKEMSLTFPHSSSESMKQKILVCPDLVMQGYYGILIRNHHYHNCICRVRGGEVA